MARAYRVRASALVGLAANASEAFSYDRMVWTFGTEVEAAMDRAEKATGKKATDDAREAARNRALLAALTPRTEAGAAVTFREARPTRGKVRDERTGQIENPFAGLDD